MTQHLIRYFDDLLDHQNNVSGSCNGINGIGDIRVVLLARVKLQGGFNGESPAGYAVGAKSHASRLFLVGSPMGTSCR